MNNVRDAGGLAGVVKSYSPEDVKAFLQYQNVNDKK
jgi:hypothetical protein